MKKLLIAPVVLAQAYLLFPLMSRATTTTTVPSGLSEGQTTLESIDIEGQGETTLVVLIGNAISVILGVLGIICIAFVIYAGILYLTDQGEGKKAEKAKKLLITTVIGMVIIVAAYAIAAFIIAALTEVAGS